MTNTREEVAVAKAIAQTGSKEWYDEGDEYSQGFMELAKAAIAASNSKYVAGLVEALKDISTESVQGKCGICGARCGSCIACDCQKGYWSQLTPSELAKEALNNLPEEIRQ